MATVSTYSIVLAASNDGDDVWTAEVPALGIVTEGRGRVGAERAARDAIAGYLEVAERTGRPIPGGDLVERRAAP